MPIHYGHRVDELRLPDGSQQRLAFGICFDYRILRVQKCSALPNQAAARTSRSPGMTAKANLRPPVVAAMTAFDKVLVVKPMSTTGTASTTPIIPAPTREAAEIATA